MTPQPQLPAAAIAQEAAAELIDYLREVRSDHELDGEDAIKHDVPKECAALILTAAAKMVQESGAVEALESIKRHGVEWDGITGETVLAIDGWEATLEEVEACAASLAKLRAITEAGGKP